MQINTNNYYKVINEIGVDNLLPSIKNAHLLIDKVTQGGVDWNKYSIYKEPIDKQFLALELFLNQEKEENKSKPEAKKESISPHKEAAPATKAQKPNVHTSSKSKSKPAKKGSNSSGNSDGSSSKKKDIKKGKRFQKPKVKGKGVELISPEMTFIKRFALLQGKTKSINQIRAFISSLQKAISEKRIRKTSKNAKTINEIQRYLLNRFKDLEKKKKREHTFHFEERDLFRYYKIAGAEYLMPSVRFIKAYYNLQGNENTTTEKAKNLLNRIIKAIEEKQISSSDRYYKQIRFIMTSLEEFIKMEGENLLRIGEAQLSGLAGILKSCGCHDVRGFEYDEVESEPDEKLGVMSVEEVRNKKYKVVPYSEEYLNFIGPMKLPSHIFVYGKGGSGKTAWVLQFVQHLSQIGYRILFVAKEQFDTPAFTELLNTLNIVGSENFKIVADFDTLDPKDFDFVVIDTKDDMDLKPDEFNELKRKYPSQSFIIIPHSTKDGDFTGSGEWRNVVDVMIHVSDGIARTSIDKNRWGKKGEMKIFK